jgi:hypothetical protein
MANFIDVSDEIHKLLVDLKRHPDDWENPTLNRYLEAMAAWIEAYGKKYNPEPSWDFIIQMLKAAKIYE